MEALLAGLVAKYTWMVVVVLIIGIFRMVFKPLMAVIKAVVAATPSTKDDEVVAKVESSSVYKGLCWVVDYLLSIKLPGWK